MSNALFEDLPCEEIVFCDWCGDDSKLHTYSITSGVVDEPGLRADLVSLCTKCLRNVQRDKIPAEKLFIRIAIREHATVGDILSTLGIPTPITLSQMEKDKEEIMQFIMAMSTYIEYLLEINQKEKELAFVRGEIIKRLIDDGGMKPADIAKDIGQNKSFVVNHLKLRRAFPDAESTDNRLLIDHYMTAAATDSPDNWLMEAQKKSFSPGELKKVVKASSVDIL